jgi:hypothetical protein
MRNPSPPSIPDSELYENSPNSEPEIRAVTFCDLVDNANEQAECSVGTAAHSRNCTETTRARFIASHGDVRYLRNHWVAMNP